MQILQSQSFELKVKKFTKQENDALDKQVKRITEKPFIGTEKNGELRWVFVHKFKIKNIQYLLSYRFFGDTIELIMIGRHENYYRDAKSHIQSK